MAAVVALVLASVVAAAPGAKMSSSLVHLHRAPTVAPERGRKAPVLLLLHGIGADERDLMPLAEKLDGRFFVVSARAPNALAGGGHAWFEVAFRPEGRVIDAAQAEGSRKALIGFLDELAKRYPVDPGRVYAVGFSQGAILAASVMLTAPEKLAGVVMMSGRILPEVRGRTVPPGKLKDFPVLVVHGSGDQKIPVSNAREARTLLGSLPVALRYEELPMGHEISAQSLAIVSTWLRERLDTRR